MSLEGTQDVQPEDDMFPGMALQEGEIVLLERPQVWYEPQAKFLQVEEHDTYPNAGEVISVLYLEQGIPVEQKIYQNMSQLVNDRRYWLPYIVKAYEQREERYIPLDIIEAMNHCSDPEWAYEAGAFLIMTVPAYQPWREEREY